MAAIILFAVAIAVKIGKSKAGPTVTGAEVYFKERVQMEAPSLINPIDHYRGLPHVDGDIDVVNCARDDTTWSHGDVSPTGITGGNSVNTVPAISVRLCVPPHEEKPDIPQIATQGMGTDKG